MKKIAKLSIIMLLMMFVFTVNVYAKPNCNINMQTKQEEVKQEGQITIDVNLSDIQSERGIIAIEAMLEYEKDCLTLSKMEGQNSWHTPVKGLSYNESNGKLVIDKEGLAKSNETILKITFIANKTNKKSTVVSLKNIVVADGTAPAKIGNVSKNITIKSEEEKTDTKPTTNEGQKTDIKPTLGKDKNTSNTKLTNSEKEKLDTKQTLDEEQEENTNEIFNEEKETNIIFDEGENTNQTIGNTDNDSNFKTQKNKNLIVFLLILLLITIIVAIIIYERRKNNKKRRMR